jgi:uncharacterized protein YbjQ (UPF0145 family)
MSGREQRASRKVFGSTLMASGYALVCDAGLVPLAPVMGCDVRSLSIQLPLPVYRQRPHVASPVPDQEYADDVVSLDDLDHEVTAARHRAYDRLREGAVRSSADAIVDVRQVQSPVAYLSRTPDPGKVAAGIRPGPHPYFARILEYQVIGTAVRDQANPCAEPRLSNLSAADLWRLSRAGWQAIDVVGGCAHRFGASLWGGSVKHEVQGSTAVWGAARQAAFAQLKLELARVGADGVLGISMQSDDQIFDWTERVETVGQTGKRRRSRLRRQGILVSVNVLGTAVRRVSAPVGDAAATLRIMDLSRS